MKQSKEHTPKTQDRATVVHHLKVDDVVIEVPIERALKCAEADAVTYAARAEKFRKELEALKARKPRTKGPDDLLTFEETSARLNVSPKTLRAHIHDGAIRFITIGQGRQRPTYRFAPADIDDFIKKQTQQEAPPCPSTRTRARRSTDTTSGSTVIAIADRLRSGTSAKRKP